MRHLDNMAKVMLATGSIVGYGTHGSLHVVVLGQPLGVLHDVEPYVRANGLGILDLIATNLAIPLTTLWSRKLRVNVTYLFHFCRSSSIQVCGSSGSSSSSPACIAIPAVELGNLRATKWDYMIYVGTMGLFTTPVPVVRALSLPCPHV